jgi:hypothetical protein
MIGSCDSTESFDFSAIVSRESGYPAGRTIIVDLS